MTSIVFYRFIVSPWSGIADSYEDPQMFANGVAFFLLGYVSRTLDTTVFRTEKLTCLDFPSSSSLR